MSATTLTTSIFGALDALPRGPHGLSREQVGASQRARLMAAVASVVAERGYASSTITEIARRAGVSPNVFYEHFRDKEECFLAAYEIFAETLLERLATAVSPTVDWHEFIAAALDTYLSSLEVDRMATRAFNLEMSAAGPVARKRLREGYMAFARLVAERHGAIRRRDPSLGPLPERVYIGFLLGVRELVGDALESDTATPLTDLAPDILRWLTAMLEGAAAAAAGEALAAEPPAV